MGRLPTELEVQAAASPSVAARRLAGYLNAYARRARLPATAVAIVAPDGHCDVTWPDGPLDWAHSLCAGHALMTRVMLDGGVVAVPERGPFPGGVFGRGVARWMAAALGADRVRIFPTPPHP